MRGKLVIYIALSLLLFASTATAGDYFGFGLGTTTKPQAMGILKAGGGRYDTGYSYQGKGELPSIKLKSYGRFNRFGRIKEAWLQFDPSGKLFIITVTWHDAGKTYKAIQDGLAAKYRREGSTGFGFNFSQTYRDGTTRIVLDRNTFGFGGDQTTTLTYTHIPSEAAVQATKNKVEQLIRKENAKRTGGDL